MGSEVSAQSGPNWLRRAVLLIAGLESTAMLILVVAVVGSSSSGYGNYVVIAHAGGLDTLYGHLAAALVKVGDRVTQGQPVGVEGSTGNSTGAHLHFELRINQKPVDPAPYLPPGAPSPFKG